eukprot:gene4900-5044_t
MTAAGCASQASGTTCALVCLAGGTRDPAGAVYTCVDGAYSASAAACAMCSDGLQNGDENGPDCGTP